MRCEKFGNPLLKESQTKLDQSQFPTFPRKKPSNHKRDLGYKGTTSDRGGQVTPSAKSPNPGMLLNIVTLKHPASIQGPKSLTLNSGP
jgi:hypothetical protein